MSTKTTKGFDTETVKRGDKELIATWETVVNRNPEIKSGDVGKTIMARQPLETFNRQTMLGSLPRIDPDHNLSEFDVTQTLGQGGMGLVRLARQTSLWRDVAIKTILPDQLSEESTHDLLQESWVTGMLEHPNIVPIHALGLDEQGAPMLVMKRVEGVSWQDALTGKEAIPTAFREGRDLLEDHIQILLQVCNGVQFAHSKGIIHCDLKPENVMLGDFGEVYLLDWGIAVSTDDDQSGRLPQAKDLDGVSGTPSYIAPELTQGDGDKIGVWTDVYLLGSILHQVVCGEPRHKGKTVMATLLNAYRSQPVSYGESVPPELASICNRATHAEPSQRFEHVDAFRGALVGFLRHRDSLRLSDEASVRLTNLKATVSVLMDPTRRESAEFEDDAAEVYQLFAECRFGFEQAITIWEDNSDARHGLQTVLETMIDFELFQRDDKAASLLVEELSRDSSQYDERLNALRVELAQEAADVERHKRISHDVDITLASRQRSIMCVFLGFLFGGVPFINHWLIEQGIATLTFQDYFTQFAAILIGSGVVVALMRKRLFQNTINTRIVSSIFIILGGCLIMRVLGYILGLDPAGCIALENGLLAFGLAMMAAAIDPRIWPASLAFLAGAVGGAAYPESILHFDGASNAAALWIIAFAWRSSSD